MFSATEYYIYNPADGPKSYSIAKKQISLLNDSTNHQTIQKIIKATDANKSIPKVNILDVMEMVTLCWEDLTEETVKKCFIKFRISSKDQANTHNNLDDPFIELRSNMEKLKSLGVNAIPEELTPEEFENFNDTVVATELTLSDQSILAMVHEVEKPDEVESDEEDGDDTTEVNDKSLENPTSVELRSVAETLTDFSPFMELEEV